jgi:hypothetical protein
MSCGASSIRWLSAGALVAGLALMFLTAEATAAPAQGNGLLRVLSPKDEGFPRGARVTVRIRLAPGAKLRSAELNNVGVRRFLERPADSRIVVARLERDEVRALRRGRNFLRFLVRRGKARDYRTVAFTLVRLARRLVPKFRADYSRQGLRVLVVASRPQARIRARLNGEDVSAAFAGPRRRQAVWLNAADGLRQGRNVLRVRVTHFSGQARYFRRVVVVPRTVTIADAGAPPLLAVGEPVQLDGSASRPVVRPGGKPATGGLRFRWSVVSAPRESQPLLEGAEGPRPVLRADRPGRYRIRLATTMHGNPATASYDTAEAELGGEPFIAVNTMATVGGRSGVSLALTRECEGAKKQAEEPCFYANPGSDEELQLLVLERATLAPFEEEKEGKKVIVNRSYETDELEPFAEYMRRQMVTNPGSKTAPPEFAVGKMVILALRSGSIADKENLEEGLSYFNVDGEGQPAKLKGVSAPFSMIAVPGALEGKAALNSGSTEIVAPDGSKLPPGAIAGVFKEASDKAGTETSAQTRAFAWPDAISYDTRAGGTSFALGAEAATIVPAGQGADSDGIAVFTFDPVNPGGSLQRAAFVTNASGAGTDSGLDWKALAEQLESIVAKQLGVALVSNGDIGQFIAEPQAGSFAAVQRQLELLGVNPDILARAVAGNGTYSMISAGKRPGSELPGEFVAGYSASSALAEGVPGGAALKLSEGRLGGALKRTSYGAMYPINGNPTGTVAKANLGQILYQDQKPWLLTPAPEATAAGCQEVAFAYLAERMAGVFEGTPPQLWTGSDAAACEAEKTVKPSSETEPSEADSLVGDECAESEAVATGASGAAVREASMALRSHYPGVAPLLPSEIESVRRPAEAPFTEADLTCARNQMVDELNARIQVRELITHMEEPLTKTQALGLIEIEQAAEQVEVALLAKMKGELEETSSSTASFWASFALGLLSNVAGIATTYGPENSFGVGVAALLEQSGYIGGTLLPLAQGPEGNPVALTDRYIFLAEQLQRESISAADRIEQALSAQLGGIGRAEEILVSDPGKLAATSKQAKGAWDFDKQEITEAGQASVFRSRQLVYQTLWPATYSGVRLNYKGYCHASSSTESCWNGSEWSGPPISMTHASQGGCYGVSGSFPQAFSGRPSGLGAGNEYQPRTAPGALGTTPSTYQDYLMVATSSVGGGRPQLAEAAVLAPFFAQPTEGETKKESSGQAAGFYPPEFWWQNVEMTDEIQCYDNGANGNFQVTEVGGPYEKVGESDVWPTPPRSFCARSTVSGAERATCTYDEGYFEETSLDLERLVEAFGGSPQSSGIWIGAYGGGGAHGGGGEIGEGGAGGAGGFARTYASSATKLAERLGSSTVHYYLGEGGYQAGGADTGAGGSSTVVASADISVGELAGGRRRPCIASESGIESAGQAVTIPRESSLGGSCSAAEQNILLIAGGGGGGGHSTGYSGGTNNGKAGGGGGTAIATTKTRVAAGAQGSAQEKNRRSHAGFNGVGGGPSQKGHGEAGGSGIGGYGGPAGSGGKALWVNAPPFFGAEQFGSGGEDGSGGKGGHGGGGGGGFGGGGGGGGGGQEEIGGSGGAGGGSYAYKGDEPPTANVPIFAPPSRNGSLIVVIDDIGTSAVGVDSSRSCRLRQRGPDGRARARLSFRNLDAAGSFASSCATARALAGAAAKRPRKSTFRARGFRCRTAAPVPAQRSRQERAGTVRWICTYRASGHPGHAKVKFTLRRR